MAEQRKFLLDASVLIQANRQYYGFDICTGFWDALLQQHQNGRIFSIDRVKAEIDKGKDKLKEWALSEAPDTFFLDTDAQSVVEWFTRIVEWVQEESQYTPEAKAAFASVADGWLIASAKAKGLIVVTQEEYKPDVKVRVPIPNVCYNFGAEFVNTFEMLREIGVRFVLQERT